MLKIRRYRPEDNETVKKLHYAGIEQMMQIEPVVAPSDDHYDDSDLDNIESAYIDNRGDFLVGTRNGEIVVIGALREYTETCGEIKRLRVRREYQRQGHAETMMRKLEERAKELGYRKLILDTLTSNKSSQQLFKKCGFNELRRESVGPFQLSIWGKKLNEEDKVNECRF
jgi:ribosomal protein S18 acetylase RimI-like enzyme